MNLTSFFGDLSVVLGLLCLALLAVGWVALSRSGRLTRESRIIFTVMFVLAGLFLALTLFGK
jgi:drug/metabolite transporter (DMT)-like permease